MYIQHFELKKPPFRANATGMDVFVGPQIAATMASLKAALTARDAIVAVCGPTGSGKTTLALRALSSFGVNRKVIHIGRMRLDSADVLELLTQELDIESPPAGTVQRFIRFRHRLKELQESGTRVFLSIEDSARLGVDTIAEIEALTAADAGESDGASVLLMGDEDLDALLTDRQLVRTAQRMRKCHFTTPFCAAELRGYLRHCFRLAGGDFEQLFEANAAPLLHHLCGGIPRVTNNLVDAVMQAAADQGLETVTSTLVVRIAENEFGLDASAFDMTPITSFTPAANPKPVETPAPETKTTAEISDDSAGNSVSTDAVQPTASATVNTDPLPTELANEETALDAATESSADEVPAWDRDPTLAELRPDFAALEEALAGAHADEPALQSKAPLTSSPDVSEIPELIPEITLDNAINQRVANNLIDEPGAISAPQSATGDDAGSGTPDLPVASLSPTRNKSADSEIEQIAKELAKAKSIDDVDEKMAETLFGDELSLAASQFIVPVSANEDLQAQDRGKPTSKTGEEIVAVTYEATGAPNQGGTGLTASQRFKTVRALNANSHPSLPGSQASNTDPPPTEPVETPDTFESQISSSMTQTLEALNVGHGTNHGVADKGPGDEKSGFFSRFKRP